MTLGRAVQEVGERDVDPVADGRDSLRGRLTLVWMLLANDFSAGSFVLGLVLGLAIAKFTSAYWPVRPPLRYPLGVIEYVLVVSWDIIVSNVQVAYLVLFRRGDSLRSQFVAVPLDVSTHRPFVIMLAIGGFLLQSTLPVNVTFAQLIAPISAATVSSLMMGFAWGTGGLSVPLVGMMADRYGIERALMVMSALPLVAALLALSLPSRKPQHTAARASDATTAEGIGINVAD